MNIKAIKEAINYAYENSRLKRFYFFIFILLCAGLYFFFIDINYIIGIPILILEIVLIIIFCNEINDKYRENLNNIIYLPDGNHVLINKYDNTKENLYLRSGKREGVCEEYYNNDQIKIKSFYVNGIKEGVYEEYYNNGKIKIKSFYEKPLSFPVTKKFGPEDNITLNEWREQTFQHLKILDNQQGFQYYYNEDGILIQKSNFVDNIMVSFEEYYKSGKLKMVNFKESYCYYSEANKKTCEITIDKQTLKPKGIWINYDKDEIIDYKLNFDIEKKLENEDALKIIYDKLENVIKSETINFQLSDDFKYYVETSLYYAEKRFNEMAYKYYGNTGAFKGCKEEIILDPILSIHDFLRNRKGKIIRERIF